MPDDRDWDPGEPGAFSYLYALEDQLVLYHRLLSGDEDEAEEILEKRLREKTRAEVFDEILIPALLLADCDRARGEISQADHQYVVRTIRGLADSALSPSRHPEATAIPADDGKVQRIVAVSARSVTDETIWAMLGQLVVGEKVALESVGSSYLALETTAGLSDTSSDSSLELPALVCVISVPPGGLAQARYICRRLRAKLPVRPSWRSVRVPRPGGKKALSD